MHLMLTKSGCIEPEKKIVVKCKWVNDVRFFCIPKTNLKLNVDEFMAWRKTKDVDIIDEEKHHLKIERKGGRFVIIDV